MSATVRQARDEMNALFKTAWGADVISQNLPLLYDDTSAQIPSSGSWARITIRHTEGGAETISRQRFRRAGTIFVQVFTPFDDGGELNDDLVQVALRAFEGQATSPGGVWFRRGRVNEVGQEGQWFQTNVLVDFEYDEIH